MSCSNPNAVAGGTEITTGPYADGALVVYQCNTGYAMSGAPYVTCSTGVFTGTYPVCNLQDTNSVTVNQNDSGSDDIPSWLFYLLAALVGMIMFLIITCIFVWCCQLLGGYGAGGLFGSPNSGNGVCCCRGNNNDPDRQRARYDRECKMFPRRYMYDEHGRRFHYDDVGRACYYNHKHQNGKVTVVPLEEKASEGGSVTVVSDANEKKIAKVLAAWKPHANPMRNINTSTK